MFGGLVGGLICAWILSIFNFDVMVSNAFYELFDVTISNDVYYVCFALLGAICGSIKKED
ncbi:hypothetical protein [Clostridium sp. B9]|uniref:hypothetical protein n=1 Tax=Clostridium sp. B9 TaxID=3423224 RepID=UPI003D2F07EA